jgi:hypothetical protein
MKVPARALGNVARRLALTHHMAKQRKEIEMNRRILSMTATALTLAFGGTAAVAQDQGGHGRGGASAPAHAGGQIGGAPNGAAAAHNNAAHNAPMGMNRNGGSGPATGMNRNAGSPAPQPHRQVGEVQPHRQPTQMQSRGNAQISRERGRVETTGQASHEERRGFVEQRGDTRTRTTNEREINERSRAIQDGLKGREPTTTGQGAAPARAPVNLTSEQRTRLHEVFAGAHDAPRLARVDFDLAVGRRVPRSVRFIPVPEAVFGIEPAWRGYDYFEVADEIVIIDPVTLEIVAVVDI